MIERPIIGSLHGLRGLAALTVVLGHARSIVSSSIPDAAGAIGVMLFFALSGFLMVHLYIDRRPTTAEVWIYARARFARIYPLFASVCVLSATMYYFVSPGFPYKMDIEKLGLHLVGLGSAETIWTVSTELQFYAAFVLVWLLYARIGGDRRTRLALVLCGITAALWMVGFPGDRIALSGYFQVFTAGMLAALFLHAGRNAAVERLAASAIPILLAVYVVAVFVVPGTIGGRTAYQQMGLVAVMGGLVWAGARAPTSFPGRALSIPPMIWLGEVSFGLYLLHRPVSFFVRAYLPDDLAEPLQIVIYLVLIGLVAHLAHILIEKPGRAFFRGRSAVSPKTPTVAATPQRA